MLSHPAAGIADLGLGCYASSSSGRGCARRRVVVVVVVVVVLCSPPPVGSVSMLARARGQTKHEGHTGTSDSSILHQNNVNQTSAFGPWLLLLRRGLANLTTSRLRWTAAAVPEPTPQRTGRSRLPVPQPQGSVLKAKSALRRATALEAQQHKRAPAEAEQRERVQFFGSIKPLCKACWLTPV